MKPPLGHPRFLALEEVLLLHRLAIMEFGGSAGVRDQGLLESALAQPATGASGERFHAYPFGMAAAYGYHLTLNHPFVDGNKRVGWSCLRTFLYREGFELEAPAAEAIQVMLNVAAGTMTKEALERWIEDNARARPSLELRDFFVNLSYHELQSKLVAIAESYSSGGPEELTAIVREACDAIPCLDQLAFLYQTQRQDNEQAIHYMQLLAAIYRMAEEQGYAW